MVYYQQESIKKFRNIIASFPVLNSKRYPWQESADQNNSKYPDGYKVPDTRVIPGAALIIGGLFV